MTTFIAITMLISGSLNGGCYKDDYDGHPYMPKFGPGKINRTQVLEYHDDSDCELPQLCVITLQAGQTTYRVWAKGSCTSIFDKGRKRQ